MRNRWLGFVVALLAAGFSLWAYPRLPATVPTHWNFRGDPDGYSSRLLAAILLPVILFVMTLVVQVLPKIDPKARNYPKFRGTYWLLMNGILVLFGVLHVIVLANGLGAPVPVGRVIPAALGLLLLLLGNYLGRVEPNWFLGIRTPWTLTSDTVWRKTHRTAGWLFVLGGVFLIVMGVVRGGIAVPIFIVTVVLVGLVPVVQSYVLWRREQSP